MRKFLKIALGIVLTPVVLVVLLMLLVFLPPVQDFAVKEATEYASDATGMQVSIDRLRLTWLLDIDLQGVEAIDEVGDTLLKTEHCVVDLDLNEALDKRITVEDVTLKGVLVHSKKLIDGVCIDGSIREFCIEDAPVRLEDGISVRLPQTHLDEGDVTVTLLPTEEEPEDTTSGATKLKIEVASLIISNTDFHLSIPADTLGVDAHIGCLNLSNALVDLFENRFDSELLLTNTKAELLLGKDSVDVPRIDTLQLAEAIKIDSIKPLVYVRGIHLKLPDSWFKGNFFLNDSLGIDINSDWSREDIIQAAKPWLTEELKKLIFSRPRLQVDAGVNGTVGNAYLKLLRVRVPSWLCLTVKGEAHHILDSVGDLQANLLLQNEKDQGRMTAKAVVHKDKRSKNAPLTYDITMATKRLHMGHVLHQDSLGRLTMEAHLKGVGTDIQNAATHLAANLEVDELEWKKFCFEDIRFGANWGQRKGNIAFSIYHPDVTAEADMEARLSPERKRIVFEEMQSNICVDNFNLAAFGIVPKDSLAASVNLNLNATGGIKALHVDAHISDLIIQKPDTAIYNDPIHLTTILSADTTQFAMQTGDLDMAVNGRGSYVKILEKVDDFMAQLEKQIGERRLNQNELRRYLPDVSLKLNAGKKNNVYRFLALRGITYNDIRFGLRVHPEKGVRGGGRIYGTNTGTLQLDTLFMRMQQDTVGVNIDLRACNAKNNPQYTFDTKLHASLLPTGVSFLVQYLDEKGRKGIDMGAEVDVREDGFHIHFNPLDPVLAYRNFHLNEDNYLMLRRDNHVYANINLLADDGTGILLYSTPNEEALQDISVGFNKFNLGELSRALPYMPKITGLLHGDVHLVQTTQNLSVATELEINDMSYEGAPLGQVGLQAVYLPNADGTHFVDGSLLQMGMPIANFSGAYDPREEGDMKVDVDLERFPLTMVNGFLPEDLMKLSGVLMGNLHVKGSPSNPDINGKLINTNMGVKSEMYSLDLHFDDDTIGIDNGLLDLDKIKVRTAKGADPLVIDGLVHMEDLSQIAVDVSMQAKNYELINAKKTQKSVAYGKVYVDIDGTLKGKLDDLYLRGKLNVLGKSKLTYVLKDSPLSVEDELSDLVTFVDFNDTLKVAPVEETTTQNMHIDFDVNIDNTTQVNCLLSADGGSYVKIEGGGNLKLTASPNKELALNGRYTISEGTLKYTMMIIPLKSFLIKNGSYVEFNGPIANPILNITATERMRVNITQDNQSRSVNFDVGLSVLNTLENLGLDFQLSSPDDAYIQTELSAMTPEQRSKAAITMLATGMYVSDTGTSSSGTSALNAFLQSQINNFTGKVLKDVDLSLGVDLAQNETGKYTTDYSFRFAKRFWGNRISVIIGGSVSSGNSNEDSKLGKSLIDNVSVEYRLDKSATRYVNVFYNKKFQSVLEGEVIEMGAGIVLRRKSDRLGDLFIFRTKKKEQRELEKREQALKEAQEKEAQEKAKQVQETAVVEEGKEVRL